MFVASRNYNFNMESRVRDLETISAMRKVREQALELSRAGDLASVLLCADGLMKHIYVVKLLDVHPRLGKVVGRRLLDSLGVSHFDRVGDLGDATTAAILNAVGEAR